MRISCRSNLKAVVAYADMNCAETSVYKPALLKLRPGQLMLTISGGEVPHVETPPRDC
jgi:hypothetical protein